MSNPITWLESGSGFTLLWSDEREIVQVVQISADNGATTFLTQSPMPVISYAAGPQAIIYASAKSDPLDPSPSLIANGFVMEAPNAFSLFEGRVDGYDVFSRSLSVEVYTRHRNESEARRVELQGAECHWVPKFVLSPNGRFALVNAKPTTIDESWSRFPELSASVEAARNAPLSFSALQLNQLFLVDLEAGRGRPLLASPMSRRTRFAWAPDSRSVVIGPTFVPEEVSGDARDGHIVMVSVEGGSITQARVPDEQAREVKTLSWPNPDRIVADLGDSSIEIVRRGADWIEMPNITDPIPRSVFDFVIAQNLNLPPKLYQVGRNGCRHLIYDPNPNLQQRFKLGRVEHIHWRDTASRIWSGLLYYPVDFSESHKYPMVIQTHGHAPPEEFSLYGKSGPGLGPGYSSFAAQPLANRGAFVLQIEDKQLSSEPSTMNTYREAEIYAQSYEAAISFIDQRGFLKSDRVGILGFSRTCWHVAYAISQAPDRYAAAIISDGIFDGILQWMMMPGFSEPGGPPTGEDLQGWLRNSPVFNAASIRTPLRLQSETGGLLGTLYNGWELLVLLRRLRRPVEFYVAPDIEHGTHVLQNPKQVLAIKEGAVDWFDFWLNDHEVDEDNKRSQYARWRILKELRDRGSQ